MALWGFNGTMPQSGLELSKEFNPENPPLGSTVIATFVWLGSGPNIITAVTDEIETGQQVGNTYALVEYVSAGGISMATYVACNVQNFPSPKRVLGEELLIRAHLSTAISGGGLIVSAYTGVTSVCAQVLGAHRSASGSGSTTPTTAHPGSIAVEPGQFVYAVSMTSEGLAGRLPPAGFTYMTGVGNESPGMQFDVEYLVPSGAGSVDPAWGWSFNSQNAWLATIITLNPAGSSPSNQPPVAVFTPSCSALTCNFTNTSSDPDGSITAYNWTFGDGASSIAPNPSHTYATAGTFTVTLTATDDRGATTTTWDTVTVATANQPPTAAFTSSCSALTCTFTSTSSDPDGSINAYSWNFGDGASSIAPNPSHTYATAGTFTVTLTATDDRGATNAVSHPVTVATANQPPTAAFTSSCSALTCTFTSTSSDPDGSINAYSWTFGDGGMSSAQNPGHTYGTGGTYTVTLTVTDDRGAANAVSHDVTPTQPPSGRIALDQFNGTLNERDTSVLAKGFNPTNPRLGDAVIATIFWVGPATIVSVTDFMTNSQRTPVGNTFHLVQSVSRGGVSMATYVATNIQGFAEPNPDPSVVYAVQARLSQTPPDGGLLLSAYSGVDPTFANALAGSQSTSGVGTGITPVDPGALTVSAGTLVYAVSMSNGLFGSDKPLAPFADIGGGMGDPFMVADGVYAVAAGAGSLHPRWTYYFDGGQYAWLTTILALNPAP